jgi:hypothetical protein
MKKVFCLLCLLLGTLSLSAQNTRITTYNRIGWYNYFGTFRFSEKFSLHTEYQWRRNNFITEWQQSLLRVGLTYHLNPRVLFRVGYAWVETFPYGEIPINSFGKTFTEHRTFQMVQLSHKEGIIDFSHRFMLEQRFVGRYNSATEVTEAEYPLMHRFRYMFRTQIPLKGKEIKDKTPYIALYDEILIGFGKNVNANIFDQNRIGVLIGYRVNKYFRFEGGYLNQILELGRQVNGRNVFQMNNGFLINTFVQFDLFKKKKE